MDTKTLCLGVLTLGDASGYDIRKRLDEDFKNFMDISSNAVYPALKALEQDKLVTSKTIKQHNYPDKTVYSLTKDGHAFFSDALLVLEPKHKVRSQFYLLMLFADMLPAQRMKEIMDARLAELNHWHNACAEWKKGDESKMAGIGSHFLVDYATDTVEAEISFIKKNVCNLIQNLSKKDGKNT